MSEDSDLTFPQIHGIAHADDAEAMSAKAELAEALQKACEYAVNNVPGYVSQARSQWAGPSSTSFANELDDIDKSVNSMNNIIVGYPKGINSIAETIRTFKDDTDALAKEYEADLQEVTDADDEDLDGRKSALREEYNKKARKIMRDTVDEYKSVNSSSISEPVKYDAVKKKDAPAPRPEFTKAGTTIAVGVFAAKASKLGPALHHVTKNPWGKIDSPTKDPWGKSETGLRPNASKLGYSAGIEVGDQAPRSPYYTAPNLQSGPTLAPPSVTNAAPGPQLQGPATNPTMPMLGPLQSQSPTNVGPRDARNGQRPRGGQAMPPGARPAQSPPPAFGPNTGAPAARPVFATPTVENGTIAANPAGTTTNGPAVGPGTSANPGAGSSAPRTPGAPMRPGAPTTVPPPQPDRATQPTQQVSRPPRIGAPSLRMGTSGNADNRAPVRSTPKRSGHVTVGAPRRNGEWGRNPWARKPDSVNPTRPVRRASIAPKTGGTWGNNPWTRRPTAASVPRVGRRPVARPVHATGETPRHSWGRNPWVRPEKGNTFYPPLRARKRKDDKDETEANVYDSQAEIDDDEAELKEAPLSAPVLSRLLAQASPQERQRIIAIEAKKLGIAQSPSSGPADNTSDNAGAKQAGKEPMASSTR